MRVIHARVARADFAKSLGEMREWLDRHKSPLDRFETEVHRGTIMTLTREVRARLTNASTQEPRNAFRNCSAKSSSN